ncbi:hypothetical protein KAZ01_02195 [Candidatus Gracilibacteria bacterium]|nr:hypothetical protein [Candidatus Gracilibacteria bacterium]
MIIFINGSINSGKSTVARILAKKIPKTANVEVDSLRDFISWLEIDKSIQINLENTILIIRNFVKNGYNVVIPYPLTEKNYKYISHELDDFSEQLYFFTLAPNIEKITVNTKDRKLSKLEISRIQYHYDIGISKPSFGKIIDNTGQVPEETASEIFNYLPK